MDVNSSLEQIAVFSRCISNFREKIKGDCAELQDALSRLEETIDDSSVGQIKYEIKSIGEVIDAGQPVLERLGARVTYYYFLIKKVKNIASGG